MRGAGATRVAALIAVAGAIWIALLSCPGGFAPIKNGLDASWIYAINWLHDGPFRFGRDVVFTYGPLGFLDFPVEMGHHVAAAGIVRALAQTAFCALLVARYFRTRSLLQSIAFYAVYAVAIGLGEPAEFHLLIIAALAVDEALERESYAGLAATAAALAPLALIKFSFEAANVGILGMAAVALVRSRGRSGARAALGMAAAHVVSFGLSALFTLGSLGSVLRWVSGSREILAGYSVAMSVGPGWTDSAIGAAIALLLLAVAVAMAWRRSSYGQLMLLLLGPLFLAFKHGFVREDPEHLGAFYTFAIACAACTLLDAVGKMGFALAVVAAAVCIAFGVARKDVRGYYDPSLAWQTYAASPPLRHVREILDRGRLRRALLRDASVDSDRLPAADLAALEGTTSIIPWELTICAANPIDCAPLPTLQMYAAYTAPLAARTAEFFASSRAPQSILIHSASSVDTRLWAFDIPIAWRIMLERYRLRATARNGWLVLGRKEPRPLVLGEREPVRVRLDEWQRVPPGGAFEFAEIPFRLTLAGQVARVLYRVPLVWMELRFEDRSVRKFRIVPDVAAGGLLLSHVPDSLASMAALFRGDALPRPLEFRFGGPGLDYYQRVVTAWWRAASWKAPASP